MYNFDRTPDVNYQNKIVVYEWKKAKVIEVTYWSLVIVLQEDWRYKNTSGIKTPAEQDPHKSSWNNKETKYYKDNTISVAKNDVELLDKRKNPERHV